MKSEGYEEETHHTFQAQKKQEKKKKQEEYREKTRRDIDEPHRTNVCYRIVSPRSK